ncbi:hypothetical protein [Flavobacterium sp. GCM10023249]|uniref:hypothetical protein n=1 Tax=unclassified Flavobacterium TaxID=196869 RepID=UPI00360B810F
MIENKTISEKYSKINDSGLINLWKENHKLTDEAREILKSELKKRNLEFEEDFINESEDKKTATYEGFEILQNESNHDENIKTHIKEYVKSDYSKEEIYKKIKDEYDVDDEYIDKLYSSLKNKSTLYLVFSFLLLLTSIFRIHILSISDSNIEWHLFYLFVTGLSSILFFLQGIEVRKKYR